MKKLTILGLAIWMLAAAPCFAQEEPALTSPLSEQPGEPGDVARMFEAMVPRSDLRYTKKTMQVLDTEIAYVDEGTGNAIVFIHGAPESIYVCRNILPYL